MTLRDPGTLTQDVSVQTARLRCKPKSIWFKNLCSELLYSVYLSPQMPYLPLFSTVFSLHCHFQCISTTSLRTLQDPAYPYLWNKVYPHWLAQPTLTLSFCIRSFSYAQKKITLKSFMQKGEILSSQEQIAKKKVVDLFLGTNGTRVPRSP